MQKLSILLTFAISAFSQGVGTNQINSSIWGDSRILNITNYKEFGELFTYIQGHRYFAYGALALVLLVIGIFIIHYLIIGPKTFSHKGKQIYTFSIITRFVHLLAAISWIVLVPTGFIMMFGEQFGGGVFVRICKNLHSIATIIFAIALLPMFFIWFKRMLPASYDIKWMMIVGGYLSKIKKPVPAGKFNAGQKAWFWVATLGGLIMILTGSCMYFLDFDTKILQNFLGLTQINLLRISAIIHNILGAICATFLLVHIYMATFAIKGSIHSMITGYKEEEEVQILHSYWYKELKMTGQI